MEVKIKDKIIIAIYIPVGQLSMSEVDDHIKRIYATLPQDDSVMYYVIPTRSENAKAECIYPVFITNEEITTKTHNVLDRLMNKMDENEKQD